MVVCKLKHLCREKGERIKCEHYFPHEWAEDCKECECTLVQIDCGCEEEFVEIIKKVLKENENGSMHPKTFM